nr:MAG TPA: hypothetical protein [Caudoviricetes sp.]
MTLPKTIQGYAGKPAHVEHPTNGRWTGSRPGFRFDSGCYRSMGKIYFLKSTCRGIGAFLFKKN